MPNTQKPCGFRQLCSIAKELLTKRPALLADQGEWKALVKDRAQALGFPRPWSHDVTKALDAVEHVHQKHQRRAN
jgi:hypothetical protein